MKISLNITSPDSVKEMGGYFYDPKINIHKIFEGRRRRMFLREMAPFSSDYPIESYTVVGANRALNFTDCEEMQSLPSTLEICAFGKIFIGGFRLLSQCGGLFYYEVDAELVGVIYE